MAASRKDSRGYALRTGECQRKDKINEYIVANCKIEDEVDEEEMVFHR